jgi:thiol:disulfide interchange protein DsbD
MPDLSMRLQKRDVSQIPASLGSALLTWMGVVLIALLLPLTTGPAFAKPATTATTAPAWLAPAEDAEWKMGGFLPPEEAFHFSYLISDTQTIVLIWNIAEGYALYKDYFHFRLVDPDQEGLTLHPFFGAGEWYDDPEYGRIETYTGLLELPLLLNPPVANGSVLTLEVAYRGCARAGLCYPPLSRTLSLSFAGAQAPVEEPVWVADSADSTNTATSTDPLETRWQHPLWQLMLFSFLAGVGMAFSACVYPMIPIVTAIVCGPHVPAGSFKSSALAAVYVLAMSAIYALAGVVAALLGINLQARAQSPWVLLPVALLFLVLSLAAWGLFQLQLPSRLQTLLAGAQHRLQSGNYRSAALMGALSALIVGPCTTPVLAGALTWMASGESVLRGGLALWALGLGMGAPLLLIGWGAGALLPKAGAWMQRVRFVMGALLLALGLHFVSRLLPVQATLWLVALWWGGVALALWMTRSHLGWPTRRTAVIALCCLVLGLFSAWRAEQGATHWQALFSTAPVSRAPETSLTFDALDSLSALERARLENQRLQRPFVVKVTADWCSDCRQLERTLFSHPRAVEVLNTFGRYQLDISTITEDQHTLMQSLQLFGPPALLFFDSDGNEIPGSRLVGRFNLPQLEERASAFTYP